MSNEMNSNTYRLNDGTFLEENIATDDVLMKLSKEAFAKGKGNEIHVASWDNRVRADEVIPVRSVFMDITKEHDKMFTVHVDDVQCLTGQKPIVEPWQTFYAPDEKVLQEKLKSVLKTIKTGVHKENRIEGFEHEDEIEAVRKILPHGSGINDDWKIEVKKDVVVCKNAYERMNEVGMYDGVFPFSVRYTKDDSKIMFHSLGSREYRIASEEGLKGYLEDKLCPLQEQVAKICDLKKQNIVNLASDTNKKKKTNTLGK